MSSIPVYLRVILIRHGQSENNRLMDDSFLSYWTSRRADAGLTTIGQLQAERAGAYLYALNNQMPIRLSHIYTSAMSRALQTTTILYNTMETIYRKEQASVNTPKDNPTKETILDSSDDPNTPFPLPRPEVWVDVCETGGLFEATPPSSTPSASSSSSTATDETNTTANPSSLLSSGSSTAALLAAAPVSASGSGWRGVKGLSRSQINELYPCISLGTTYPVVPSTNDTQPSLQSSSTLTVTSLTNPSEYRTYPSSIYSPTGTAGYVTDDGWWLNKDKETEAEGMLRARRVANALHQWAVQLGEEQLKLEEQAKEETNPNNLPVSGGFENITKPSETSISLPTDINTKELNRRYGGSLTKHDGPSKDNNNKNKQRIGRPQGAGVTPANDNVIHQGKAIAIVCHGDFIDNLMREIMFRGIRTSSSSSPSEHHSAPPLQVCSSNGSFNIFDIFPDGGARIVRLNDCRHLVPIPPVLGLAESQKEKLPSINDTPNDKDTGSIASVYTQYPGLVYTATSVGPLLTGSPL